MKHLFECKRCELDPCRYCGAEATLMENSNEVMFMAIDHDNRCHLSILHRQRYTIVDEAYILWWNGGLMNGKKG